MNIDVVCLLNYHATGITFVYFFNRQQRSDTDKQGKWHSSLCGGQSLLHFFSLYYYYNHGMHANIKIMSFFK